MLSAYYITSHATPRNAFTDRLVVLAVYFEQSGHERNDRESNYCDRHNCNDNHFLPSCKLLLEVANMLFLEFDGFLLLLQSEFVILDILLLQIANLGE